MSFHSEELGKLVNVLVRGIGSQVLKVEEDFLLNWGKVLEVQLGGSQVHQGWARWTEALVTTVD